MKNMKSVIFRFLTTSVILAFYGFIDLEYRAPQNSTKWEIIS